MNPSDESKPYFWQEEHISSLTPSTKGWAFEDDIFLYDNWDVKQALLYLLGLSSMTLRNDGFSDFKTLLGDIIQVVDYDTEESHSADHYNHELARLGRLWHSGVHKDQNPPAYYIDWAISKKYEIPWLAYAIKQGFYNKTQLPIDHKLNDSAALTSKSDWKVLARQIGIDIYKSKPNQSIEKISVTVRAEMVIRHESGEAGMTGRGGRIPSAETVRRRALTGIKA